MPATVQTKNAVGWGSRAQGEGGARDTRERARRVRFSGVYQLQAATRLASEEWILDLLRVVPVGVLAKVQHASAACPRVMTSDLTECCACARPSSPPSCPRSQLVPTHVTVELPEREVTRTVAVSVTTTAAQFLQQLSFHDTTDYFRGWSLCLRRGDHVTWLEPDDLVVTLPVVFKVRPCRAGAPVPAVVLVWMPDPERWPVNVCIPSRTPPTQSHQLQCHRLEQRQHVMLGVRPGRPLRTGALGRRSRAHVRVRAPSTTMGAGCRPWRPPTWRATLTSWAPTTAGRRGKGAFFSRGTVISSTPRATSDATASPPRRPPIQWA